MVLTVSHNSIVVATSIQKIHLANLMTLCGWFYECCIPWICELFPIFCANNSGIERDIKDDEDV